MPVRATYLHDQPPAFGQGLRLAIFQGEGPAATRDAIEQNLETLAGAAALALDYGAQLLALPELFLSGYIVYPEVVAELAEPMNGPSLQRVGAIAQAHQIAIVCPYAEVAEVGGQRAFYDAIALFGPEGSLLKNYRKTHLWGPDEKRIWTPGYRLPEEGEAFTVHEVNGIGVGLLNCYEAEFPELSRILAVKGAEVIVIPTAADDWVLMSDGRRTTQPYPDVSKTLLPAHAFHNRCFIAYCNRCGQETVKGEVRAAYLGNSIVIDPLGGVLLSARNEPTLLVADCIPAQFGPSHPEDTRYLGDRRADLYHPLL